MKITPHHVKITGKDIRALVRDGSIPSESYEKVEPYFKKAEQVFPKSYTLTSLKGPTMASQVCDVFVSTISHLAKPRYCAPPRGPETWDCEVFARVLSRAKRQLAARPRVSACIDNIEVPLHVRNLIVKERTNGDSRGAQGWGSIQIAKLERREGSRPLCLEVAAATYPDENLTVLSLGCVALQRGDDAVFDSESRLMVGPLTHGIDSMIHAAIISLILPKSLMEVRAAIKRAFSPTWFASLRSGEGVIFSRAEYRSNAAIFLLSIVHFRKHLFVANIGKNQAFLWRKSVLTPLSVVHDMTDPAESRRVSRGKSFSRDDAMTLAYGGASRSLFKYGSDTYARPQISCLPLSEVSGGYLIVLSPGVAETIGSYAFRQILNGADSRDIAGRIGQCARLCGLASDICTIAIPLNQVERIA